MRKKKSQKTTARLRREVAELRASGYRVGLGINHPENESNIERVELRVPRGYRVTWQLDPDEIETAVVAIRVDVEAFRERIHEALIRCSRPLGDTATDLAHNLAHDLAKHLD